jgi:hypothetical protein
MPALVHCTQKSSADCLFAVWHVRKACQQCLSAYGRPGNGLLQGSFGFLIERAATMDVNLPRALSRTPEVRRTAAHDALDSEPPEPLPQP